MAGGCYERVAPDPEPKSSEVQQVRRDFNALAEPAEATDSGAADDPGEDAS
jgi:hypothetical protein